MPVPQLRDTRPVDWVICYCTYIRESNAESSNQDNKRFNCQVRRNTLLIWVYYLAMFPAVWNKAFKNQMFSNYLQNFFLQIECTLYSIISSKTICRWRAVYLDRRDQRSRSPRRSGRSARRSSRYQTRRPLDHPRHQHRCPCLMMESEFYHLCMNSILVIAGKACISALQGKK